MVTAKKTRRTAYKSVDAIEVKAWGQRVGAVAREPTKNYYAFEYDPAWIRSGVELAPIAMPLAQAGEPFIFTDLPEATFKRLPALLADALPDDFGNALIDAWMADRGIRKDAVTALDRLAYMGKRGMGALTFGPMRGPIPTTSMAVEMVATRPSDMLSLFVYKKPPPTLPWGRSQRWSSPRARQLAERRGLTTDTRSSPINRSKPAAPVVPSSLTTFLPSGRRHPAPR